MVKPRSLTTGTKLHKLQFKVTQFTVKSYTSYSEEFIILNGVTVHTLNRIEIRDEGKGYTDHD